MPCGDQRADLRALLVGAGDSAMFSAVRTCRTSPRPRCRGARRAAGRGAGGRRAGEHEQAARSARITPSPPAAAAACRPARPGSPDRGGRAAILPSRSITNVSGMPAEPNSRRTRRRGRAGWGSSSSSCARTPSASSRGVLVSTPSTSRPAARIFSCVRSSSGSSVSHGAHHEAQKFSTTTLPGVVGQRAGPRGRRAAAGRLPAPRPARRRCSRWSIDVSGPVARRRTPAAPRARRRRA